MNKRMYFIENRAKKKKHKYIKKIINLIKIVTSSLMNRQLFFKKDFHIGDTML